MAVTGMYFFIFASYEPLKVSSSGAVYMLNANGPITDPRGTPS